MIRSNTVLRAICTLAAVCAFAATAMAQSVLNFTPKGPARIAITNTTPHTADVKFTFYNSADGVLVPSTNNPRSYRLYANTQLLVNTSELAPLKDGVRPEGWIQAISDVKGLQGYYFSGDSESSIRGAEAASPAREQTLPYIPSRQDAETWILVTNPGSQSVDVSLSFYDEAGRPVAPGSTRLLPHEQKRLKGTGATVRVVANTPGAAVLATAVVESATSPMLMIHGQTADSQVGRWVVPYFKNTENITSSLVLANPLSNAVAAATVSFYNDEGERVFVSKEPFLVPANGFTRVTWENIAGPSTPPVGEGWVQVESLLPLTGVALVTNGETTTAIPLQSVGSDRILLSRPATRDLSTRLTLVGDSKREATLKITLSRPDGTTAAQSEFLTLPALKRHTYTLRDLVPSLEDFDGGFLTIRSERQIPVFSLESMDLADGSSEPVVTPQRPSGAFMPGQVVALPRITKVSLVGSELQPGARLKIDTQNVQDGAMLWVGNQSAALDRDPNGGFTAVLPPTLEPGNVSVRVRYGGLDSNSEKLGVYSEDPSLGPYSEVIKGTASFQKIEVTDNGLDTNSFISVPVRNARVEVVDGSGNQKVISVGATDESGYFEVSVPNRSGLLVRVVSQLRGLDVRVLNNSSNNNLYAIPAFIDLPQTSDLELKDSGRSAGAFNILDVLQRGNALIMNAAPGLAPPALTVYWSEKNDAAALARLTNGAIRTTFFNPATNSAYILGDRNTDSDEFDDSVILHEYAHLLAVKFSRDDSNGGTHVPGDLLDPRIAWSEGWANFFSAAARGISIYRDSKGLNNVLRLDLEDNVPVGDHPGYTSEASVGGLLWDLFDENADRDDLAQFPFAAIWAAFTDLSRDRNVYLPFFLEHFLQRNQSFTDGLRTMVVARSIDFQPDVRPSVTNPFPRTIAVGGFQQGQLDSVTTRRTNLTSSSHFFSLSAATNIPVVIRLTPTGLGPAVNPSANDLDLFLYDSTGKRIIEQSDETVNGGMETISTTLVPGIYYIEVRSFYTRKDNGAPVFNSGSYKLSVDKF